ncbi:MAG: GTP cyclohydrolase I FolE [Chloroflexi bacterium]|nr:GTP cyclohydrolase I FolE [Chloroflexota bacterium]
MPSDREKVKMFQRDKIEKAIEAIIEAIGDDPKREGLRDTPRRIAQMYQDFFSGIDQNPSEVLVVGFDENYQGVVVLKDIPFYSICEHHLLPFFGTADIGYVPNGRVVGASKLARALDILAHRPQLQERLTDQLADTLFSTLQTKGVGVILQAEHLCLSIRGATKPGALIVTSATRGCLTRSELLDLVQKR